jgi:hypothetical protein
MDHDVDGGPDIEPESGNEVVLGADRTTDDVPPLQHRDLQPCLGEVTGTYQAVVSGSDDDHIR